MVRPYINLEKDSLITLRDGLTLLLCSLDKKSSLYSDSKYELEQIIKELSMR